MINKSLGKKLKGTAMSKQYPECPLYNHATCKELHNPKLCAIIRDDKTCHKKQQKPKKENSSHPCSPS
jgi:hypothetical protein